MAYPINKGQGKTLWTMNRSKQGGYGQENHRRSTVQFDCRFRPFRRGAAFRLATARTNFSYYPGFEELAHD
jgi:hypothetical protein